MFSLNISNNISPVVTALDMSSSILDVQAMNEQFGQQEVESYFNRQLTGGAARAIEKALESQLTDVTRRTELYNELERLQDLVSPR